MLNRKLALAKTLLRLGLRRLVLVWSHRQKLKKGAYLRLTPAKSWSDFTPQRLRTPLTLPGRTRLGEVLGDAGLGSLIADADRIVGGELRYFSWDWRRRTGWRSNPDNGFETPLVHWSQIKDFDAQQGDIKWIWEPSRFDWAVTLARAFAATGDAKYERTFITLLKDWREHNPPNQGINWYCGQECSLRLMSLLVAATVFLSPEARDLISTTIAALAERVEPTMGYAIGQHNNHGTSEAAGLYLAGCALPDHPSSTRWRTEGKKILERLVLEQFAIDGSYVQHSFVYQRLSLRACLLAALAARRLEDGLLDGRVEDRLSFGVDFLRQMMVAPGEGRLPNYGANDGANAVALSQCAYLDFRPVIQVGMALLDHEVGFDAGPWNEELLWFGLPSTLPLAEPVETEFFAMSGGYARISEQGWDVFMRAPNYTDGRPGQADALHVDVWYNGRPVAIDSGTYSYNDLEGWSKHFKSTAAHNTVMVDGKDQMPLASRFLYTDWTKAELHQGGDVDEDGTSEVLDGFVRGVSMGGVSHAYEQIGLGIQHRRSVGVSEFVVIADTFASAKGRRLKLIWHLDGSWERQDESFVRTEDGVSLTIKVHTYGEADPAVDTKLRTNEAPYTVVSEYYGRTRPITVLEVTFVGGDVSGAVSTFSKQTD